jgi:hypothetical protein
VQAIWIFVDFVFPSLVPTARSYVSPGCSDVNPRTSRNPGKGDSIEPKAPTGAALTAKVPYDQGHPFGVSAGNSSPPGLRDVRFPHVAPPWAVLGSSLRD